MGGAVILPCSLHEGQTMVWVLATSFKRTYANTPRGFQHYCIQWPRPHSRPLSTHTSTGDSQAHTGKSGSVCCGVTAPFSQVLVCTRSCLGPQESVFPSPGEFLQSNLTGLHSEISCGFSDICWVPRLGNPLWITELSPDGQYQNQIDYILWGQKKAQ